MKNPLGDRRFINKRNFWNEQVPSAEVIYNDATHNQHNRFNRNPNTEILSHVALQVTVAKHESVISLAYSFDSQSQNDHS